MCSFFRLGGFLESLVEHVEREVDILLVQAHWWLDSEDVSESAALSEHDTIVLGLLENVCEELWVNRGE